MQRKGQVWTLEIPNSTELFYWEPIGTTRSTRYAMNSENLLHAEESPVLEFKRQCPPPAVLANVLCAFANTSGGDLLIGVEDRTRTCVGIDERRIIEIEEKIANVAASAIEPPVYPLVRVIRFNDRIVIAVHVEMGFQKPYTVLIGKGKSKVYVRIGSSTREADPASVELMRLESRGISWDSLPCMEVQKRDLSRQLITDYIHQRKTARGMPLPSAITDSWLVKSRFAVERNGKLYPSNAAVLLFFPDVASVFPSSGIEFARFKGTSPRDFIDKQSLEGPISALYDQAVALLRKHLPVSAVRNTRRRREEPAYPFISFKEFLVNALCHRVYMYPCSPVRVAVFDDVVEITNSGGLHPGIELSDLGTGISLLRNQVIARVFNEIGLIEGWGTGIQVAQDALRAQNLPTATFREKGAFFQVSSPWRWPLDITEREQKILEKTASEGRITSETVATLFNITDRGARKTIAGLIRKGLLRKTGTTKSASYVLQ